MILFSNVHKTYELQGFSVWLSNSRADFTLNSCLLCHAGSLLYFICFTFYTQRHFEAQIYIYIYVFSLLCSVNRRKTTLSCHAILQSSQESIEPLHQTAHLKTCLVLAEGFSRGCEHVSRLLFGVNGLLKGCVCLIGIVKLLLFKKINKSHLKLISPS